MLVFDYVVVYMFVGHQLTTSLRKCHESTGVAAVVGVYFGAAVNAAVATNWSARWGAGWVGGRAIG